MTDVVVGIERFRKMMSINPWGIEVTKEEFDEQLLRFNITRDSWWNADVYYVWTNNGRKNIGMCYLGKFGDDGPSEYKYFLE
jgi:hypothetical protein